MKTNNIISTPNIEGNIGSCTIQSNEIRVSDSLFTSDYSVTQINSCTGKIVGSYNYTSYAFPSFLMGAGVLLVITILALVGMSRSYY